MYSKCNDALGSWRTRVCLKLTGTAPPVVATVKDVWPTVMVLESMLTVAVRLILLGVLLDCEPRMVSPVVVVMFMVVAPFKKRADPLPLVVESVNKIVVELFDGVTVAVIGAVLPCGTTGVSEKVTVGVTFPGDDPPG